MGTTEAVARARSAPDAVLNQVPPLAEGNAYTNDRALVEAVDREGVGAAADELTRIGATLADPQLALLARDANRFGPTWSSFDAQGHRVDRIDFHPAWHTLMTGVIERGLHSSPWEAGRSHGHTQRAAAYLMQARVELGTLCPTTMTYGSIAALRRDPDLSNEWLPKLLTREYDPRDLPLAEKRGALVGMGMTEKQGGSDVRANTTRAVATNDGTYRITGHKWFYSAPQCDAHLVLAYATDAASDDEGLSCFVVPRYAPDDTKNAVLVQRLKDKVGNRSNASSEVEFHGAWARRLGDPGRGVPTILEMGTFTRLDCVLGTAGMMREAVVQAIHHARHRNVFGSALVEQPLMRSVLADLALESEAATALALRLAHAFDGSDELDLAYRRVMTSAAKFWVCKRGPELAAEAMEVLGGNGYVEEGPLARVYREMPVNSIWEGSGNIMCLDVLRAFGRSASTSTLLLDALAASRGSHRGYDAAFERFAARLRSTDGLAEAHARSLVRSLVTLAQASLLLTSRDPVVGDAFCATRLDPDAQWGAVPGEGIPVAAAKALVDRAYRD
jgi:putative acyl-CoA dehydrogenase